MNPKLVYDDACTFCTWAATFATRRSDIVPVRLSRVQERRSRLTDDERERLPAGYEERAHLLTEAGIHSGGAAMEQSLLLADELPERVVDSLRQFGSYERLREETYRLISEHRGDMATVFNREPPVIEHVPDETVERERAP